MLTRRRILKYLLTLGLGTITVFSQVNLFLRAAYAATKRRIVERGTPLSKLMHANPARLDTSRLETTPIEQFDVMGETFREVDVESWRLAIEGAVTQPMELRYEDLCKRPVLERNVLLVCPGFFAYNGRWQGFSVAALLQEAGFDPEATQVKLSGSGGFRKKSKRFKISEVLEDKIFIAYAVNGQDIPQRHGFPMRLVAEDHRGHRWIKYLNHIEVIAK